MARISPFAQNYVRSRTAELMDDECRITAPGEGFQEDADGNVRRNEATEIYSGPCRFWEVNPGAQADMGGQKVVTSSSYLTIPYDAPVPEPQHNIEITKSVDPSLVGKTVRVLSIVRGGGLRASRRFLVEVYDSTQEQTW